MLNLIPIIIGLLLLILGRKVFWLFVGAVGFLIGFILAGQFFHGQPEALLIVIGMLAGLLGAALAVFLQQFAISLAGFLAGGYLGLSLWEVIHIGKNVPGWLIFLIGGIFGAGLVILLFDWALIFLSSLSGAALIIQAIPAQPGPILSALGFLILAAFGIAIQASWLGRSASQPVTKKLLPGKPYQSK